MKANLLAALLSLFVVSIPVHSANMKASFTAQSVEQKGSSKINLNQADAKTLSKSMKGIGLKRAAAIVKYREDHGKFKTVEDLAQVRGFGHSFVQSHLAQLQAVFVID